MSKNKIIAGIDPGVKTGLAIWDCAKQEFRFIGTSGIILAMSRLRLRLDCEQLHKVIFEDARLRGGKADPRTYQGVGSVKRDSSIWQEFCKYYEIPFQAIKPESGQTKWSSEYFKKITSWKERTSQHARDAAVLVLGIK